MKRVLHLLALSGALVLVDPAWTGCASDTSGSATGGGGGAPDGGATCEEAVQAANPAKSRACATCLCTSCEEALTECDASSSCQDTVNCADAAVAAGTCAGDISGASCLMTACGFELIDPAAAVLLCTSNSCSGECIGD